MAAARFRPWPRERRTGRPIPARDRATPCGATVIGEGRCGTAILAADGWRIGFATWSQDGATIVVNSRRQVTSPHRPAHRAPGIRR